MKKLFIAAFIFVSTFTTNTFAEVKMGIILGFTGPIESLTPVETQSRQLPALEDRSSNKYRHASNRLRKRSSGR
jgi:branched-chain amino acid transport system substrate-binding protein